MPIVSFDIEFMTVSYTGYDVAWEEESDSVTCLHALTHAPLASLEQDPLQVTSVAWSASGSVVAASYPSQQIFCILNSNNYRTL